MTMKPVFGYLRVSGKGQLEGDGFARQREAIERWCQSHNACVIRWFQEEAVSGTVESMERPAFREMIKFSSPVTALTIVVETSSRLARDLMVSELLIQETKKRGIEIFEAVSGMELSQSDDPTRVMIRQMLGVLSQWEKTMLVHKLRASRERTRKESGRCEGTASWVDRRAHPALEKKIRECIANNLTLTETQFELNFHGFRTPQGKRFWTHGSVSCAIRAIQKSDNKPAPKPSLKPGAAKEFSTIYGS